MMSTSVNFAASARGVAPSRCSPSISTWPLRVTFVASVTWAFALAPRASRASTTARSPVSTAACRAV